MSRPEVKDEPDIEGRTAFMWAASKGADDVILTFVKCGVDIHQTGKNGGTGLYKQLPHSLNATICVLFFMIRHEIEYI